MGGELRDWGGQLSVIIELISGACPELSFIKYILLCRPLLRYCAILSALQYHCWNYQSIRLVP